MVFSVYGINALLPVPEDLSKPLSEQPPYYQYIIGQINNKLSFGDISSAKSVKCSDGIDTTEFRKIVYDYSSTIYAAKQEGQPKKEQLGDSETVIDLTLQDIVMKQFISVQKQFYEINEDILDDEGILEYELGLGEINTGTFGSKPYEQILTNIIAKNPDSSDSVYDPPDMLNYDVNNKEVIIPNGFYSKNERLANGGFFLERGFEVARKHKEDEGALTKEDYNEMVSLMSAEDLVIFNNPPAPTDGTAPSLYRNQFKKIIFGHLDRGFEAYAKTTTELFAHPFVATKFSQWEGKLSFAKMRQQPGGGPGIHRILQSIVVKGGSGEFKDLFNQKNDNNSLNWNSDFYEPFVEEPNKLFKKFNYYLSFNLLLPVEGDNFLQQAYENIKEQVVLSDLAGAFFGQFIKSAWERKYFVRENDGGKLYLKIPLLTFYDDKNSTDSISHAEATSEKSLTELNQNIGTSPLPYETSFGASVTRIATDFRFREFARLIEYRSLLSFIAILVSEMIEKKYPKIEGMFDDTMDVLATAINTLLGVANRNSDSDFYQIPSFDSDKAASTAAGLDFDLMSLILNLLVKMLANMSDPTWKTPWFLPGPLTPFGIIAKILDAIEDGSSDASGDSFAGINDKQAEIQDKECSDEGNS